MHSSAARGFTTLEFVIALGVFAVGLGALLRMHIAAARGAALAQQSFVATRLAADKLEQLAVRHFDALASGSEVRDAGGPAPSREPRYLVSWSVTPGELRTIEVAVSWEESSSRRVVTLATQRVR